MHPKGACFYGDPLPGGTNPHHWVILCSTEQYVVMVSFTTPRGKFFAHRVRPTDFPCLRYDSNVCWERANVFVHEIPDRMESRETAAKGAVEKLITEGRQRKLIPADINAML
jgi:hypothetical protein